MLFPLPLQHVQGIVRGEVGSDGLWRWTLNNIEARGSNDATIVKCQGGAVPHDSGCEIDLTFEAFNMPLDDNLRGALAVRSPAGERVWTELNPSGSIDFTARVTQQTNELQPAIEIALRPYERSVTILPRLFPYRLDELQGVAVYKRGEVTWQSFMAKHDRSVYSMESGSWKPTSDGGWQCNFFNANVDRLIANHELMKALPRGLQVVIEKLQPRGTIGLYKGNLTFTKPPQVESLLAAWDVSLECQQTSIQAAVPIQGINGGIRLIGRSDGRTAFTAGELALDSILCKNAQLTNIRGPFWTDSSQCLFGEPACAQQNQPLRRLTADAYGGSLATNVKLQHGANPAYEVDVHLGGANLARFANERLGGANDLNGTVSGKLAISGAGSSLQSLRGAGELHVVDANIYELPQVVAMLKLLRNRTPDTTAFNRCDMKFTVQGEHIHFQHLNLLGDAMSFYGNGEADFNRRLDLAFYTLVGPADLPIWRTIAGHMSQQGLEIKVTGPLADPHFERKPFPAINDMLNQLQTDIQNGAATISPSTAMSGSRPPAK
jgi:hypothetical protein